MINPAPRGAPAGKLIAAIGAAAATLLLSTVATFEGKSNVPYRDVVGVPTVCYGETQAEMRHYSDAECKAMLADRLAGYAGAVLARNPELRGHPNQLTAASSLTYNIGTAAYRQSNVARLFSARRWPQACDAFLAWSYAGGRQVAGLLNRRRAERALCLTGLKR